MTIAKRNTRGILLGMVATVLSIVAAMVAGAGSAQATSSEAAAQAADPGVRAVYFQIRTRLGSNCLDVDVSQGGSGANGVPVQQWDCLGQDQRNQLWELVNTGDNLTYFIKPLHNTNKCLDADSGGTGNGIKVQQWDCNGQANQRWRMNFTGDGYYRIQPNHDASKCLEVDANVSDPTVNGVPVEISTCISGGSAAAHRQHWWLMSA